MLGPVLELLDVYHPVMVRRQYEASQHRYPTQQRELFSLPA